VTKPKQETRLEQMAQELRGVDTGPVDELQGEVFDQINELSDLHYPRHTEETVGEILGLNERLLRHVQMQDVAINKLVEFCRLLQGIENGH